MRGRSPAQYKLEARDRAHLQQLLGEGALSQRVARRVQALLALDVANGLAPSCIGSA
jgi:hypothetical protein